MLRKVAHVVIVLAIFAQGCGTIVYGTRQNISVNSNPVGAKASIDGVKVETPATVSLSRSKDYVVTVEKEGYESGTAQISRSFNGVATILGNILWLLPGIIVDLVAGGAWTLEPETVNVSLKGKR